jgi:hypothetical protein
MKVKLNTREEAVGVERWLKLNKRGKETKCPFSTCEDCERCKELFPKCADAEVGPCPCQTYSHSYVVKKAERLLIEYKKETQS